MPISIEAQRIKRQRKLEEGFCGECFTRERAQLPPSRKNPEGRLALNCRPCLDKHKKRQLNYLATSGRTK